MIDNAVYEEILSNYLRGTDSNVYLIRAAGNEVEYNHNEFIDLAIYLDGDIIRDPSRFSLDQIGGVKQVKFEGNKTRFILGNGFSNSTEIFSEHVENLKKEYLEIPMNLKASRGLIKTRLNRLEGVSVKIFVGGITEEEKKARMFLVEDAVLACKSVLAKGYTSAGNSSILHSLGRLLAKIGEVENTPDNKGYYEIIPELERYSNDTIFITLIISSILSATVSTYVTLLKEYDMDTARGMALSICKDVAYTNECKVFNVKTNRFELLTETTAISPSETDIQTLKASVSIVGMLLSINQFVS
jgi:chaperonin GroEL (HSP60 family)